MKILTNGVQEMLNDEKIPNLMSKFKLVYISPFFINQLSCTNQTTLTHNDSIKEEMGKLGVMIFFQGRVHLTRPDCFFSGSDTSC